MIKIGIIGYGYWGPNLVRNFAETPGAAVAAVSDLDAKKLELVQKRYPGVKTTTVFRPDTCPRLCTTDSRPPSPCSTRPSS